MISTYSIKIRTKRRAWMLVQRSELIYRLYASIKGPLEDRDVEQSLRRYREDAARQGISAPVGMELQQAVRQRLAGRGVRPVPKRKGELHIFATFPGAAWQSTLPTILAPFGEVSVFDWRRFGYDDTSPNWLEQRDAVNRLMVQQFLEASAERHVDVVVGYLSGHEVGPETLTALARSGAVIVNICMDDKGAFPGPIEGGRHRSPAAIAAAVDLNLTTSAESVIKYAVHGGLAVFWPPAADPTLCQPYDVPFELDVSFVGGRHCWRPFFIDRLQTEGIHIETFGPGWDNGPVAGVDLMKVYCRSRINLGFSSTGNSRNVRYLKNRDFEIPMCGALYLTQANPELAQCFEIGKEIVVYDDERDCAAKIRWLLESPEEADRIRRAGRARALRDHTWDRRFTEAFEIAGLLESDRSSETAARD
jgi:spore maturation protein CgeB